MTSQTPGGCSIHWATRNHGEQGQLAEFICDRHSAYNVQFKKISILPPQKRLEFPGRRGVLQGHLKKCVKLNWNFQRGGS